MPPSSGPPSGWGALAELCPLRLLVGAPGLVGVTWFNRFFFFKVVGSGPS